MKKGQPNEVRLRGSDAVVEALEREIAWLESRGWTREHAQLVTKKIAGDKLRVEVKADGELCVISARRNLRAPMPVEMSGAFRRLVGRLDGGEIQKKEAA